MISKKIKISFLLLIFGIFGFLLYFLLGPKEVFEVQIPEKANLSQNFLAEITQVNPVRKAGIEARTNDNPPKIIKRILNWGYETSILPRSIDTIIIHSSYDALGKNPYSLEGVLQEYKIYGVAAHYLIDRQGNIYQLVEDENIAYQAGKGKVPDGRTNVNDFSIGIELIYRKEESPDEIQYLELARLVKYLREKYNLSPKNIFGHSDIAPGRKTDPWNFNWQRFETLID
jgi:N-acetyl-anhydromuramyl-L-alanine amidase AmpD